MDYDRISTLLGEKKAPDLIRQWLGEYWAALQQKGPAGQLRCLAQIGVRDPTLCDCTPDEKDSWLHQNHLFYNTMVWRTIESVNGCLPKLRSVLQRDLRGPDQEIGDAEDNIFGSIVLKSFGRELLENFLTWKLTSWVDLRIE